MEHCCKTTAAIIDANTTRDTFQDCPFRDVEELIIDGVKGSCMGHISNATAARVCGSDLFYSCCQSCHEVLDVDSPDCYWGDDLTCKETLKLHGLLACTWAGVEQACCKTCSLVNHSNPTFNIHGSYYIMILI